MAGNDITNHLEPNHALSLISDTLLVH
uniref:Uncharacterized protein n=1 Tax=Anguilla anguilla TaxID=7936 RepID=A0A0E9VEB6_ANGAN